MIHDLIVIGSGMGSLSAAALLAKAGLKPQILEQNWVPGGCSSSYKRKHFTFESGATTLVGMNEHMPLKYLVDQTGINLNLRKLDLPMQVHFPDGQIINRIQNINQWIVESERVFGGNQKAFWTRAFEISEFVWKSSTKFLNFPPVKFNDYLSLSKNAQLSDLQHLKYAFKKTADVLDHFQLNNPDFRKFINEQLLITAQNNAHEINFLFGAAALCYTNYDNYYVDGGMINLVNPVVEFIKKNGGQINYREKVLKIKKSSDNFEIHTSKDVYQFKYLISGIPINNLIELSPELISKNQAKKILPSEKLFSAFQMGIAFQSGKYFPSLHHQIILPEPLIESNSDSIFVSLSDENDQQRAPKGFRVASVSTHVRDPENHNLDGEKLENEIINLLLKKQFIESRSDIVYHHSSGPHSWEKWTGRKNGFVGGYPQYFKTKPWQMIGSRLNHPNAYQCGDTTYPGQGIPGVTLSGIIAAENLLSDHL